MPTTSAPLNVLTCSYKERERRVIDRFEQLSTIAHVSRLMLHVLLPILPATRSQASCAFHSSVAKQPLRWRRSTPLKHRRQLHPQDLRVPIPNRKAISCQFIRCAYSCSSGPGVGRYGCKACRETTLHGASWVTLEKGGLRVFKLVEGHLDHCYHFDADESPDTNGQHHDVETLGVTDYSPKERLLRWLTLLVYCHLRICLVQSEQARPRNCSNRMPALSPHLSAHAITLTCCPCKDNYSVLALQESCLTYKKRSPASKRKPLDSLCIRQSSSRNTCLPRKEQELSVCQDPSARDGTS